MTFASHGQKSKRYAWFLPYKFGLEADDQNASPLFRLPTELRDAIWAYAVTPNTEQCESDRDGGTDAVVHLTSVTSSAPSTALLLTCGRIYNEARKMFRHAQREFWSGNTFMIELSNNLADFRGSKRSHLPNLRKRAVELMPKLIVSVETRKRTYDFHFVDEGQLSRGHLCWTVESASESCSLVDLLLMRESEVAGLTKVEQIDAMLTQCARLLRARARPRQ